jgi:hypothetical protein
MVEYIMKKEIAGHFMQNAGRLVTLGEVVSLTPNPRYFGGPRIFCRGLLP